VYELIEEYQDYQVDRVYRVFQEHQDSLAGKGKNT
jgi:hypothetical protein